jgi:hypothetical protein
MLFFLSIKSKYFHLKAEKKARAEKDNKAGAKKKADKKDDKKKDVKFNKLFFYSLSS